jgi:hypothetical protein
VVVFTGWRDDPSPAFADCVAGLVEELLGELAPEPPARTPPPRRPVWSSGTGCSTRRRSSTPARTATSTSRSAPSCSSIFDQFEQYFVYHRRGGRPGHLRGRSSTGGQPEDLRASFLISLREDAYTQLDRFEGRILNLFASNLASSTSTSGPRRTRS